MYINRKSVFLLYMISFSFIHSEYILYKIDPQNKEQMISLNYQNIGQDEQDLLKNLYINIICRYQWPTILLQYKNFEEEEKTSYLNALKEDFGLFKFIKNKITVASNEQYSIAWVPTTVFELSMILICINEMNNEQLSLIYNKIYDQKDINKSYATIFEEDLSKYMFKAFDFLIKEYRDSNGTFITNIEFKRQNELIVSLVNDIGARINNVPFNKKSFGLVGLEIFAKKKGQVSVGASRLYPIYDAAWRSIIKKYISYETIAFKQNMFLLARGTNGYLSNEEEYFDYRLGGKIGISYAYTLFAGTVFERFNGIEAIDKIIPKGARAIDYMVNSKIGYVLCIDIANLFNTPLQDIFSLPGLTTTQGLFGFGENFHPRLSQDINKMSMAQKHEIIQNLSKYLSEAKLIKITKNTANSESLLEEDQKMQLQEIKHSEAQDRSFVEHEEKKEYYDIIIKPWIEQGFTLKNVSLDYISFFEKDLLNSLKDSQLESMTLEQVAALTSDQIKVLKNHKSFVKILKYLTPEQFQMLTDAEIANFFEHNQLQDEQISFIPKNILSKIIPKMTASQIQQLTYEQVQSLAPEIINSLNKKQFEALDVSKLSENQLLVFPIERLGNEQIQKLPMSRLKSYQLQSIDPAKIHLLSKAQIRDIGVTQIESGTLQWPSTYKRADRKIVEKAYELPLILYLLPDQIVAMTPDQIQAMTLRQIKEIVTGRIVVSGQIAAFTFDQFKIFLADDKKSEFDFLVQKPEEFLRDDRINYLNDEQLSKIPVNQLSDNQIRQLSLDQIQKLSFSKFDFLPTHIVESLLNRDDINGCDILKNIKFSQNQKDIKNRFVKSCSRREVSVTA